MPVIGVELPECPVCLETMCAPIFQCQSGHSLCNSCTKNLCPPTCPICRQQMTQMRNWQLEDMISKATVTCPNKSLGCVFTMMAAEMEEHLKECIFREMSCPLGVVFGRCSWAGKLKEIMDHSKSNHVEYSKIILDTEAEIENFSISHDDRLLYLTSLGKFLFLLTIKIVTSQKMVFWVVQHIGSKKAAQQYTYEILVKSKQDNRRQIKFCDLCYNDTQDLNEVFRQSKCGVMPINMLNHFIKDNKISIIMSIVRSQPNNKNMPNNMGNVENKSSNYTNNKQNTQKQRNSGPVNSHHNQSRGMSPAPDFKPRKNFNKPGHKKWNKQNAEH